MLEQFDAVFSVLQDHDAEAARFALEWAEREGRLDAAATAALASYALSDAEIDTMVAERNAARAARNFARADALRQELAAKGILIEDSKDGVRWRRK